MGKPRTTRASKESDKYQSNTLETHTQSPQTSNTQTVPLSTLPTLINTDLLKGLTGHGNHSSSLRVPTFHGKPEKFTVFKHKLDNHLLINNLHHVIEDESCDTSYNLALYLHITSCLEGEAFQHISANSNRDGRKAYKLLCQKYQGNAHAQKGKAYDDLNNLKQRENESISSYITRCDLIIEVMTTFNCINDSHYYVSCAMKGLLPKYSIFKSVLRSNEEYPSWDQFKIRIQNFCQLDNTDETTQIMNVNTNNSNVPIIKKKQNHHKKFIKNKPHHDSDIYCTYCDTKTHFSNNCTHKNWIMAAGGLRGARGGRGRGGVGRAAQGRGGRGRYNNMVSSTAGRGGRQQYRGGCGGASGNHHAIGATANPNFRGKSNTTRRGGQGYHYGQHSANNITHQDYQGAQANAVTYEYPQYNQNQFQ